MYINSIMFLITISQGIHSGTTELTKNEKAATIDTSIKQDVQAYQR